MKREPFEGVSGQQLERLAHIEFRAFFTGKVSRKDIMERFGVGSAAATRDLSAYIEEAPDNIAYDPRLKHYVATSDFECLLPLSPEKCLSTLTSGFGDFMEGGGEFRCAHSISLERPDLEVTAKFSQAISLTKPVKIEYVSMTSGISSRVVCPHSLINDGLRWHARAYDRKRERFADLVSAELQHRGLVSPSERSTEDSEWNEEVELQIQPHPNLHESARPVIEQEFRMKDGVLIRRTKKSEVGYLLNSWNVDATPDHKLIGAHVLLHLRNAEQIQSMNIESFRLAPGIN